MVADKLNFFRYISHFRCVHRGSFFSEMRTTAVRKLLPEAWGKTTREWHLLNQLLLYFTKFNLALQRSDLVPILVIMFSTGFLCPVHTPDGSPCGLLNHLTALAGVSFYVKILLKFLFHDIFHYPPLKEVILMLLFLPVRMIR